MINLKRNLSPVSSSSSRAFLLPLLILVATFAPVEAVAQKPVAVETVRFESRLMGRAMPYNVVLPPGYHARAANRTRYPVLYLLHGYSGNYTNWLKLTKLTDYAAQHRLIIVTPEGANGWYTDSASVAADKFESYIVRELLPDVERRYRTIESRGGRAVAGLSMGGYGALKFGVKYPELFSFAASMSGAVTAATWQRAADLPYAEWLRRSLVATFGDGQHPTKLANDLFRLVRVMPAEKLNALPFLYLDCGTEDPLELLGPNRAFADLLVERKIAHEYRQLPGKHDWVYWDRQVQEVLRIASSITTHRRGAENAEGARRNCGLRIVDCGLKKQAVFNPQSTIRNPQLKASSAPAAVN